MGSMLGMSCARQTSNFPVYTYARQYYYKFTDFHEISLIIMLLGVGLYPFVINSLIWGLLYYEVCTVRGVALLETKFDDISC